MIPFCTQESRNGLSERGALAGFGGHNGDLGAHAPAGVRGRSPLKLNPLAFCVSKGSRKFAPLLKKGKYNAAVLKCGALADGQSRPCLRPALQGSRHMTQFIDI